MNSLTRALGAAILGLVLSACGASVTLLTRGVSEDPRFVGCYTSGTSGELVADADAGTAVIEQGGRRVAVIWPKGFTGRQSGSEVEVLGRDGRVVGRTGTTVYMTGGYPPSPPDSFLACGDVRLVP